MTIDVLEAVDGLVERPLRAVVAIIAMCVIAMGYWAVSADKAMAVTANDQEVNNSYHQKITEMSELLIRIDENVKALKQRDK